MSSDFYALSDAANQKTTAEGDRDFWVLNGVKRWITNAGVSEFYTVLAMTDASKRTRGITAFVVEKSDEGLFFGAPEKNLGHQGLPDPEVFRHERHNAPCDKHFGTAVFP